MYQIILFNKTKNISLLVYEVETMSLARELQIDGGMNKMIG